MKNKLHFISGNSGSGKSYELYQEIIRQSLAHPEKMYMVIVPEQFTMQTQKDLVSLHPNKGIMNIDVLSFQRLAYRIFEEVGGDHRKILEDTGKSLVLRKVAGDKQDELVYLGKNLKKIGYISEVKSMISELTQYSIGISELDDMLLLAEDRPDLRRKLMDIRVIYHAFRDYLQDNYITAEEILDVLRSVLEHSQILKGAVIALDGFTGFTPVQYKLLEKMLHYTEAMYVTVTADAKEDLFQIDEEYRLFHMSKKMAVSLRAIADQTGTLTDHKAAGGSESAYRFRNAPGLAYLEQNLFRFRTSGYHKDPQEIKIYAVSNPKEEAMFLAQTIRRIVREEGCRYKDIAIITGDMDGYSSHLEKAFAIYDIPCFIDHKKSILLNPFVEFIRAVLELAERNFDYESTFRFLRCGLLDFTAEETDILENYVLALGVRGFRRWNEKWVRLYRGMKESELELINELRERFAQGVEPLVKTLKSKKSDVKAYTEALYRFIAENHLQEKLKAYEESFGSEGQMALAKEYAQIYRIVIELFDKIVDLIGTEKMSLTEYKEILDAGFQEARVGIIPPSMDQVMVGDIQRTRLNNIRILFFAGVNDGIIPAADKGGGVISALDREFLAANKVRLAPTARENSYTQKFYLYLNMTKPSERLYLTYSKTSTGGDALRPSYLIGTMKKLFPVLAVRDAEGQEDMISKIETSASGIPYLIQGLELADSGTYSEDWKTLYRWYLQSDEWNRKLIGLTEATFSSYTDTALGKAAAKALYGAQLENSVTRLETYARCAFAHFMQYGLYLWERDEYEFAAADIGNVFHKTLELFSEKLRDSVYDWFTLPEKDRDQLLDESVEEAVTDYGNTVLYSSSRNQYMIRRIRRMAGRTVWALSEQIKRGKFVPNHYEVSFSMEENLEAVNIMLSDEEKMRLKGRIDRTDVYEKEDQVYVKVIDYKSGNSDFDIVAMYYGLQLQLVVYMNAALEITAKEYPEKEVIPAGVFYYNMKDPVVEKEEGAADIQERLLKELRMKGLVNSDPEVIDSMDGQIEGTSAVLPVSKTVKGALRKSDSLVSREQFQLLSEYVNGKMKEIGSEILDGKITAYPYELEKKSACDYCMYDGICGFDKKVPGYKVRRLKPFKTEEVWAKLAGQEGGEPADGSEMD